MEDQPVEDAELPSMDDAQLPGRESSDEETPMDVDSNVHRHDLSKGFKKKKRRKNRTVRYSQLFR